MVSKPFEIFFEKKFNSDEAKMDEARLAWSSLSAKKQIKFIRKTEASYDANENKEPLHTYLSKKELDVLMKAYGMPEKPAQNSRFYYIDKYKDEYVNGTEEKRVQEVRNDAIEKWKTLSKEKKDRITEEFHQLQDRYTDQFFNFARNLPEQRVVDFKYYTSSVKKSDVESNDESNNVESTSNSKPRKPKENLFKVFIPYEVYIEKHQPDEASSFEERSKMRSTYAALPGKKKLKYIKKAEEQYDSFDFSKSQTKPLFTSFLSKNEVQLLFDSYGMPENVPSNLSAYFMKKNFKEGLKNMQLVFNKFRGLTESEKSDLLKEHARELKDYSNKTREFVEKLPANRQDDYKFLKNKNSKSKALDDGYSQQPAKKIKTS